MRSFTAYKVVLVTICCLLLDFLGAQVPLHTYYSEFSGLAGSNVYHVMQDHQGFLWFCTNKGISRYDGTEFNTFTASQGLTDNEVLGAWQDHEERIWLRTFNGKPCYIQNGIIFNSRNVPYLKQAELTDLIATIYEDKNGYIWLGSKNEIVKIDMNGNNNVTRYKKRSLFFWEDEEGVKSFTGTDRYFNLTTDKDVLQDIDLDTLPSRVPELIYQRKNGDLFVIKNSRIYLVTEKGRHYEFMGDIGSGHKQILCIYEDPEQKLWIGTRSELLVFESVYKLRDKPDILLSSDEVTSISRDHQGGTWVSTTTGAYQFESDRIIGWEEAIGEVTAIAIQDSEVVAGYKNGVIRKFILSNGILKKKEEVRAGAYPRSIKVFAGYYVIGTDVGLYTFREGKLSETGIKYSVKGFDIDSSRLISGTSYGVYVMDLPTSASIKDLSETENVRVSNERVYRIFHSEGQLFITTRNKVYLYTDHLQELVILSALTAYKITDIQSRNDELIIATETKGLFRCAENGIVTNYTIESGLGSNDVFKTIFIGEKLYAITGIGVYDLNVDHFELLPETNSRSFRIRDVTTDGKVLFIGTSTGLLTFYPDRKTDLNNIPLLVLTVSSQLNSSTIADGSTLDYSEHNLRFEFKRISFHLIADNIMYRIKGLDDKWIATKESVVLYRNIPPGEYIFQMDYGVGRIRDFHFLIKKPYWQSAFFIVLVSICFALILITLYLFMLRNYKRKSQRSFKIKLDLAQAEQKALRAQMNPHFIFNAMNAIQNFILKKDTDKAYEYLGQFAKLIRATLHNSRKMTNSIQDEVSFLKLYLNIESLRFNKEFEYDFLISENVNCEQEIPTMILQPFVENAILHGLLPLEDQRKKTLFINITESKDFIHFTIIDNGVGIDHHSDHKEENLVKPSFGIRIVKERIALYDPSKRSTLEIIEGKDEAGKPFGTTIKLNIRKHVEGGNNR